MRKVNAIIEKASDGKYSIYMDDNDMPYLVTGTGKTVEEARKVFEDGYEDIKKYYAETGEPFEEVEFCYQYDIPSFLQEYAYLITLSGLEKITGVNQKQLGRMPVAADVVSKLFLVDTSNSFKSRKCDEICVFLKE